MFLLRGFSPFVTFLGIPFGPGACEKVIWDPILSKMSAMVRRIVSSGAHITLAVALFNRRVVPLLSYVAQFYAPPSSLHLLEVDWAAKIWRAPGRWLSRLFIANMQYFGKVQMMLPSIVAWSVHTRATLSTFSDIPNICRPLAAVAAERLTLVDYVKGRISDPHWQEECPSLRFYPRAPASVPFKCEEYSLCKVFMGWDNTPGLQRKIYKKLVSSRFPLERFRPEFFARVAKSFAGSPPFDRGKFELFHRAAGPHTVQCTARSILNGWPTTARLHTAELCPCVFCLKPKADCWFHYLHCPILREVTDDIAVPFDELPLNWCAVAYSIYTGSLHSPGAAPSELAKAAKKLHHLTGAGQS